MDSTARHPRRKGPQHLSLPAIQPGRPIADFSAIKTDLLYSMTLPEDPTILLSALGLIGRSVVKMLLWLHITIHRD
jgi:hypothetical protein